MRRFLIDTDTASDDAVALVMALRYPGVNVEAITIVAGNVPVDQGVQNALYTLELCQQDVPVYRGMPAPLSRPLETAQFVHGQDGMGDIGLPFSGRQPAGENAVDVIACMRHKALDAEKALYEALEEKDILFRVKTIRAMVDVLPRTTQLIDTLIGLYDSDGRPAVKMTVRETLRRIGVVKSAGGWITT